MLYFAAAPPPVSYSLQITPLLALQCYSCHGDSGGLSMRSYRELMLGGNLGKVIVVGKPDSSLLVHFIEGRRGAAHRMPLDGKPLAPAQIQLIRRWIAEGAKTDANSVPKRTLLLRAVRFGPKKGVRVFCKPAAPSFLTVTVQDPATHRVLFSETATVKVPKQRGDAGQPGELLTWDVFSGLRWPPSVDVQLTIEYATADSRATQFYARPL